MKSIFPSLCLLIAVAFCHSAFGQDVEFQADTIVGQVPPTVLDDSAARTSLLGMTSGHYGGLSLNVKIDEAGNVVGIGSVSGPGLVCSSTTRPDIVHLRLSVASAAKTIRFKPATLDGRAIPSSGRLYFRVEGSYPKPAQESTNPGSDTAILVRGDDGVRGGVVQNDTKAPVPPISDRSTVYSGPVRTSKNPPAVLGSNDSGNAGATSGQSRTLSGGVLNGKAISLAKPTYPAAARAVNASGAVNVQILIDEDGSIFLAVPVTGHPLLRESSRLAACEARFSPTLLEGKPVKVQGVITYNYVAP